MAHELNFIDPRLSVRDLELFLGPFTEADGPMMSIESGWTLAHLMHVADVFPSVKQAKKNGWDRPIPPGFSDYTVGKTKLRIYVLTDFPFTEGLLS